MEYESIADIRAKNPIWPITLCDDNLKKIPDLDRFIYELSRNKEARPYVKNGYVVLIGSATPIGKGYSASICWVGLDEKINTHPTPLSQGPPSSCSRSLLQIVSQFVHSL